MTRMYAVFVDTDDGEVCNAIYLASWAAENAAESLAKTGRSGEVISFQALNAETVSRFRPSEPESAE